MVRRIFKSFISVMLLITAPLIANASQLVEGKIDTKLVPSPVEYNVLLPDGYETAKEPLPLLLFLHGGGGDRNFLTGLPISLIHPTSSERENLMTEADQKTKVYTINQGVLATFIGGPLGGAILLAQNYKQFGSPQSARRAIVIGVVTTFALVPLALILPERTPNAVLPVAYSIAFRLIAERLQGAELRIRVEAGTERQSWWRTLGISVVTALCSGLVLVGGLLGITTLFPSL